MVSLNGFTYILYITEVLPAGSSMPVEAARQQIINRLLNSHRKEYEDQLKKDLLNEAKESGRIVINLYELFSKQIQKSRSNFECCPAL